ncbi:hypothetical protein CEE86_14320, partial [Lactobacillus crispatus]
GWESDRERSLQSRHSNPRLHSENHAGSGGNPPQSPEGKTKAESIRPGKWAAIRPVVIRYYLGRPKPKIDAWRQPDSLEWIKPDPARARRTHREVSHVIASSGAVGACGEHGCRRSRPANDIPPHDLRDKGWLDREPSRHGPDALE